MKKETILDLKKEMLNTINKEITKMNTNIEKIENDIHMPFQMARLNYRTGSDMQAKLIQTNGESDLRTIYVNAEKEILSILRNNENNPTGMHIKHVASGVTKYRLVATYYPMEEDVDVAIETLEVFDTYKTAYSVLKQCEAVDKESQYDIVDFDPEEYYEVHRNEDDSLVYEVRFPTMLRAMAFILADTKPAAFMALEKLKEEYSNVGETGEE